MLQIKNLNLSIRQNFRELVRDFSFALNPGDRAVLIGEEGSGKSTLLKLIYDPELVSGYAEWSGRIDRSGIRMGYLAQEIGEADKRLEIRDYLTRRGALEYDAVLLSDAAGRFRLPPSLFYENRTVDTLSGGERVKLQLVRLQLEQPDVLLLDEPTNDMDIPTLEVLEEYILSCGMPVLFVSHDEELIEKTANVIIHLEQLRKKSLPRSTVARLSYDEYVSRREDAFRHQAQIARKERMEYRAQQERWQQIYERVNHEQNSISRGNPHGGRLLKKKMKSVKSQQRRFEREAEEMTEFPDTEDAIFFDFSPREIPRTKRILSLELPELRAGDKLLSRNVSLELVGPEHIGIVGPNGAGKTTLLRHAADALLDRKDVRVGYMPQDYSERLMQSSSPSAFISNGHTKEEITRAMTYLGSMRYTHEEMEGPVTALSGGQKAKLFFLELEISGCDVLVLDEPTRNFSPLSAPVIRSSLARFGGAILSVSHDRKYLREVCTRILELTPDGLREIRPN